MVIQENLGTITDEIKQEIAKIWTAFETIPDPEIPILSILDLGMIREISWDLKEKKILIDLTPTYSGCPAVDAISMSIRFKLLEIGISKFEIIKKLSPPWTTDWIREEAKNKMKAFGIAPPKKRNSETDFENLENMEIQCPLCQSKNTNLISPFGSTACKALFRCNDCMEPFDYFKCH